MVLSNSQIKGFTLAEVLITLGIIGVVAAITIPSLISKVQRAQIEPKLRKIIQVLLKLCVWQMQMM